MIERNTAQDLFFAPTKTMEFIKILSDVQEYMSEKHSSLVLGSDDKEMRTQIRSKP